MARKCKPFDGQLLVVQTVLDLRHGVRRTYRLRGSALGASFALRPQKMFLPATMMIMTGAVGGEVSQTKVPSSSQSGTIWKYVADCCSINLNEPEVVRIES